MMKKITKQITMKKLTQLKIIKMIPIFMRGTMRTKLKMSTNSTQKIKVTLNQHVLVKMKIIMETNVKMMKQLYD